MSRATDTATIHPRDPHLSSVARGGILNLVGAVASGIFGFVLVVTITRGLGPSTAGPVFVTLALFSLLSTALELGADTGVVRMIPRERVAGRSANVRRIVQVAVVPVFLVGVVTAGLLFAFAPEVARALAKHEGPGAVAPLLRALAPFLPLAPSYTVLIAATRGFGTMVPSVVVDKLAKPALQPTLVALVIAFGLGTRAVVLAWALPIGIALGTAALWLTHLVRRSRQRSAAPTSRVSLAAEFWRFTAPRGLAGMFQVAIAWLDTLLLSALRTPREAGIYAAATRYLVVGSFAIVAILHVVGPKMSELISRQDRVTAGSVFQTSTAWLMLLTWPIYLTIALFAPTLLSLFGRGYVEAHLVLVILAPAMLIATGVGPVDVVLLMAGKSTWNLANTLLALTLNIGLNLLLIPRLGIVGAALAWAASILTNNLVPLAQVGLTLRLHPFGRGWLRAACAAGLAYGVIGFLARLVLGTTPIGFAVHAVVGSLTYLGLLLALRRQLDLDLAIRALRRRHATSAAPIP